MAIKTYEKQRLLDPRKMKNVKREISILQNTFHENIIKLHSTLETPTQVLSINSFISYSGLDPSDNGVHWEDFII